MKMDRRHICFVSLQSYHLLTKEKDSMGMGGAELQGLLISGELVKRGHRVSIITFDHDPAELEENIPFRLVRTYRKGDRVSLWKIMKAVREADADIYYLNNTGFIVAPVVLAAHLIKKKVLFWAASDTNFDPSYKWFRMPTFRDKMMYLWGVRRCDAYVVQNHLQQRMLREHFGKPSTVISNGLSRSDRLSAGERFVLWVGSMREVKNPVMFIELARRNPNARFVMVGGNPVKRGAFDEKVREEIREVPNLEYLGFLPFKEVEKLFERAGLFVNTSTVEGFPNTFLQAWSRGVPVLSTANVNPDELISRNGLGVIANDLDEMTAVVKKYMNGGLGLSSKRIKDFFDSNFTIEATVDRMEQVLDEIGPTGEGPFRC